MEPEGRVIGRHSRTRLVGEGPHDHRYLPVGLNNLLPDLGKDDLAVGPDEVELPTLHLWSDDFYRLEGLLDQVLHALRT